MILPFVSRKKYSEALFVLSSVARDHAQLSDRYNDMQKRLIEIENALKIGQFGDGSGGALSVVNERMRDLEWALVDWIESEGIGEQYLRVKGRIGGGVR